MKVSFLMAAHNEEKIIGKTLENLSGIPYEDYEVLVGLDGCTDDTEKIVKSFTDKNKKIKYYKLNFRSGKPKVIDYLIKKSSGDIIVINDADWVFKVKNKESMEELLAVFEDKKVGGIAESFPMEWDFDKLRKGDFGYQMVAYSTYYWMQFQMEKYAVKKKGWFYVKDPKMFMTNIFRKELYTENKTLGDDFERSIDIKRNGFEIVLFNDYSAPRMSAVYDKIRIKDFFNQKIRTAKARKQMSLKGEGVGLKYYLDSNSYILIESFKRSFFTGFRSLSWFVLTGFATLISGFSGTDTKSGWKLRAKR